MIDRVIVDYNGYAVPEKMAREKYCIVPDIMFKRKDGWTLGAPEEFEDVAYEMWKNEWSYFTRKPDEDWSNMEDY